MTAPKIIYYCAFGQPTGYARAAHDYLMSLRQAGCELCIVPLVDSDYRFLEEPYRPLLDYVRRDFGDPTHVVVHTIPFAAHHFVEGEMTPPEGCKRVCVTTWETTDLPVAIGESLNDAFHGLVVPSKFCESIMAAADHFGVDEGTLAVIPHAFDPEVWRRHGMRAVTDPPTPVGSPDDKDPRLVFYSLGVWGDRKNLVGTLKAYFHAFTAEDRVMLRIRTPEVNEMELYGTVESTNIATEDLPLFSIESGYCPHDELLRLHRESDVFVSTARGEGFGLGAFEAALVGNLVIAPEYGLGVADLLESGNVHKFYPCSLTPVIPGDQVGFEALRAGKKDVRLKTVRRVAPSGIDAKQLWGEPDLHSLALEMRDLYGRWRVGDYNRLRLWRERRAQNGVLEKCTYENIGAQFRRFLEAL